jgi:hypothetical protein
MNGPELAEQLGGTHTLNQCGVISGDRFGSGRRTYPINTNLEKGYIYPFINSSKGFGTTKDNHEPCLN